MANSNHIILASASPRRRELLALAGVEDFTIMRADIDETPRHAEAPTDYVQRLSAEKAAEVAARVAPGAVVIAADTIVVYDGDIIGKPITPDDAAQMLWRLRGKTHHVHTAVTVCQDAESITRVTTSAVPMRSYTQAEIATYVASGDPMDKAGAYAIQNAGFHPVALDVFEGCYGNVVGLPLCTLSLMLAAFDVALPESPCRAGENARCALSDINIPGA